LRQARDAFLGAEDRLPGAGAPLALSPAEAAAYRHAAAQLTLRAHELGQRMHERAARGWPTLASDEAAFGNATRAARFCWAKLDQQEGLD
jgi:hypothetical protein